MHTRYKYINNILYVCCLYTSLYFSCTNNTKIITIIILILIKENKINSKHDLFQVQIVIKTGRAGIEPGNPTQGLLLLDAATLV